MLIKPIQITKKEKEKEKEKESNKALLK